MNIRKIGSSNIDASVIGFGAWAIGGWMWGGTEEQSAINAIHTAFDNGVNLIDTAPMYGYGRSEEIISKAIKGKRQKIVLATKCGLVWDTADWPPGKGELHFYSDNDTIVKENKNTYRVYKYLRPESIRHEVEQSLKRLNTDYIDLLQTHWQESTTPLDDTIEELIHLKKVGKIRAIGCSNVNLEQLKTYIKSNQLDVAQERFSLLDQNIIKDGLLDTCEKSNVSIFAYSPLANGLLTGKLTPKREFGKGDLRNSNARFDPENIRNINKKLEQLKPIVQAHNLTIGQLVIAWTASKYNKMHVLCGMRNPKQAAENSKAGNITLANDEIKKIEETFAN
ncbi:MAG: aldo/keto reductase [Planctomycetaceae bacterium]|jgi:aryl-alcohol dehydrogenase-like predicted oxidoreductase|nr:aldo/keto reductase [Planctomycetaceae bacterium]